MIKEILFATTNQGKVKELNAAFSAVNLPIKIKTNADLIDPPVVDEYGTTFQENAELKAHALANFSNLPTIADDSGLMVDKLFGAPGVHSARYAGNGHDDALNNAKLLAQLSGVSPRERGAKFVTVMVCSMPFKFDKDLIVKGQCSGQILTSPSGEDGFGYDPLFYVPDLKKTFAQMTLDEKNSISHRGLAIKEFLRKFPNWLKQFS